MEQERGARVTEINLSVERLFTAHASLTCSGRKWRSSKFTCRNSTLEKLEVAERHTGALRLTLTTGSKSVAAAAHSASAQCVVSADAFLSSSARQSSLTAAQWPTNSREAT